jgi:hypothetical protein
VKIIALCHTCGLFHPIEFDPSIGPGSAFGDWLCKHPDEQHLVEFVWPGRSPKVEHGLPGAWGEYLPNADIKAAYQAVQTLTNAIEGLATSSTWTAGYESAWIDNGTNLYLDYLFAGKVTVGTTPTTNTEIRIYTVMSIDDGTTYPDVFDGTTSAETATSEGVRDSHSKLAAVLRVDSATSDRPYPFAFSVGSLYGGVAPPDFALFTAHNTAVNLNATGSNQVFKYRGCYGTSA